MRKYSLVKTNSKKGVTIPTLYRIKAKISFGAVVKGELGGYVESSKNLADDGDAWVYGDACIYGDARVYGNAQVYGNAWIFGDACIYGDARVFGDAQVYGDARVYGDAWVSFGMLAINFKANLQVAIACALNTYPIDGAYTLFKRVDKISEGHYRSCYDSKFIYEDGQESIAKDADENTDIDCGAGIHASTLSYYSDGNALIAVSVKLEDIICCLSGKIRCRKVTTIGEVKVTSE